VGVFVVVQLLDGAVLSPKIVGESVNLHPVWVILALSVFGFFFGFVGLLLAVPLAVLLKLILTYSLQRYRRSRLFLGEERALPAS
jgi:predicted PurR-regulated permease PerM